MWSARRKWGVSLLVFGVLLLGGSLVCWLYVSTQTSLLQDPQYQLRVALASREEQAQLYNQLMLFRVGAFSLLGTGIISFITGVVLLANPGK